MTEPSTGSPPRWWRRSRDLAQTRASQARATAAQAMFDLDFLQRDLPALITALRAGRVSLQHQDRTRVPDPAVVQDWQTLSARVEAAIALYLDIDANFNPHRDLEEVEAKQFITQFEHVTKQMQTVAPDVHAFLDRYEDELLSARNLTLAAPRLLSETADALKAAKSAMSRSAGQGLVDPSLSVTFATAIDTAKQAQAAVDRRAWADGVTLAQSATAAAAAVESKANALPRLAQEVRNGCRSSRTRLEALETQHERLGPVMSQLRQRFTHGSFRHVDDAPERAGETLRLMATGLAQLEKAINETPMNVPAAMLLLRQIRASASDVDGLLRAVKGTLERLTEVSANPESVTVEIRRKTVDARRFLNNLPAEKAQRFAPTLNHLATRTARLTADTQQNHPDWGAVLAEAAAIEAGIDAMIRNARST